MTIESTSYPRPLEGWNPRSQPFYLELFGESCPLINTAYAESQPKGPVDGSAVMISAAPVYEYWWTLGHPGPPPKHRALWQRLYGVGASLFDELAEDPAAQVFMFFPLGGGWRVKELAATVKYLTPARERHSTWSKVAEDWKALEPMVESASKIAGAVAGGPAAGAAAGRAATTAAQWLDTLTKLTLTSVPQSEHAWSVAR